MRKVGSFKIYDVVQFWICWSNIFFIIINQFFLVFGAYFIFAKNDQFQTNLNLSAPLFFDTLIWKVCKTDKTDEKKI